MGISQQQPTTTSNVFQETFFNCKFNIHSFNNFGEYFLFKSFNSCFFITISFFAAFYFCFFANTFIPLRCDIKPRKVLYLHAVTELLWCGFLCIYNSLSTSLPRLADRATMNVVYELLLSCGLPIVFCFKFWDGFTSVKFCSLNISLSTRYFRTVDAYLQFFSI